MTGLERIYCKSLRHTGVLSVDLVMALWFITQFKTELLDHLSFNEIIAQGWKSEKIMMFMA